jgi:hypothetical protein
MSTSTHRSALLSCCACLIALIGCESADEGGSGFAAGTGGAASGGVGGMTGGTGGMIAGTGGVGAVGGIGGAGGASGLGGTGGASGMTGGTGGVMAGTGGMTGGMGGMTGGMGAMGGTGGTGGGSGTGGGMSVSGIPDQELEMLRQVCVDEINMYRATLSLPPMDRATPQHELCSDRGAKKDGDSGDAHSSAGRGNPCAAAGEPFNPRFGSQNTCPGYPVGGFGSPTIADALKGCLEQMWDEGEPPGGEEACIEAYFNGDTACFLAHGHYINMKGSSEGVSCGFYKMENGRYWMNQDFY